MPFEPKRVFWIFSVPADVKRANHSHRDCEQAIFCLRGSFIVKVGKEEHQLWSPKEGLYIPANNHIVLSDFSENAVCLVLASEHYNEDEIIE